MELTVKQIVGLANKAYPKRTSTNVSPQAAYVEGFCAALRMASLPQPQSDGENFLRVVAKGLRELWPAGEKDGKWPWRDSVTNIEKRLEFIWKERDFGDKFTVDDCLRAGRRYLAQFQDNTKYMQILKYFVFKQEKHVSQTDGRITYTYSSKFADYLEDSEANAMQKAEESATDYGFVDMGELI